MKRVRVCRVENPDGEIHFVLEEPQGAEYSECFEASDAAEIKKISRKEAARPLVLFRKE